jgi:hypothetical protein
VTSIEKLPAAWCRTWNDDPALAHDLVTDDARMWGGHSDMLDGVVGPDAFVAAITAYHEGHGTRFTPRTLVVDGPDRLATTWDATLPDGTRLTGVDVSALRDGRVAVNWMVPGGQHAPLPDVPGSGRASRDEIAGLCTAWTSLWNGEADRAAAILVEDVAVWFGAADPVADRATFTAFVQEHRADRPGLRFALQGEPVVDVERQTAAMLWTATRDGRELGGIDVVALRDGQIAAVWSVTGARALTLRPSGPPTLIP